MPRKAQPFSTTVKAKTLVVDNGGYSIKAGFAIQDPDAARDCSIIPNCIARTREARGTHKVYIADQLEQCTDFAEMAFRRPVERGFIVNWDTELDIWKQAFFNENAKIHCDPRDTRIVLTEAPNCPQALQMNCDQMVFEEFGFAALYRCLGPTLNAFNDIPALTGDKQPARTPAECILVIDSGYSHTTVTPILHGRPVQSAIRRLEVGGKHLTNSLKEMISLREVDLREEPHLVSQIKEDACYVTQTFDDDTAQAWKKGKKSASRDIVKDYVLPDYRNALRGHMRPHDPVKSALPNRLGSAAKEHVVVLGNERFAVPELLFRPSDIGITQAGLPETVIQSLSAMPPAVWPGFLANVVVVGGNAKIPGFMERLESELRALTPEACVLRVVRPDDPVTYTWLGGARLANNEEYLKRAMVTREEYQEHGSTWTLRKFAGTP